MATAWAGCTVVLKPSPFTPVISYDPTVRRPAVCAVRSAQFPSRRPHADNGG
jgi:acyl-CoA reductase-like NAD-dependent aldehyde dehydrogenase